MKEQENNKSRIILLKAAESLFAHCGYDGTSIRAIAEKSGINSAMINYYFGSKESLYHALFETHLQELINKINDIEQEDKNPATRLEVFLEYYCRRIQDNQYYYRILFSQLFGIQKPEIMSIVGELRISMFLFLKRTISDGVSKGLFLAVDEEIFAMNIMTLLPALNSSNQGFLNLSEVVHPDISQRVVNYFLDSLGFKNDYSK